VLTPASGPLLCTDEHDLALLLSAEPQLAGEICARVLAPLAEVRGATARTNLEATLAAWLSRPGQRKAVAHELGVHPQTVRYRVGRLRELFGESLEDPERRFELELALRLRRYARLAADADAGAPAVQSSGVV
jgi:DNA-binding PucR family transcriptional regulator